MMFQTPARTQQGFTLIEVMVSLMILAAMSLMAWKGMDGIVRSREIASGSVKQTLRLQSVMTQWQADLNAVLDTRSVQALQFDGAALRMTRRAQGGVQVVVWALRSGRWVRWAGEPVASVGPLQDQWNRSLQLQGSEPGALGALKGVQQWQVYFFRGGSWTNAQSSGDVVRRAAPNAGQGAAQNTGQSAEQSDTAALARAAAGAEALPTGVRCVLTLGEGSGFNGAITRDVSLASQPGQN